VPTAPALLPHLSHWGAFRIRVSGGAIVGVEGHPDDPAPSRLLANIASAAHHPSRIAKPMLRRGWLERGPGPAERRGADDFVEVEWPEALGRLAIELDRVRWRFGNAAIFGGSYGWASAGRFHHAQRLVQCSGASSARWTGAWMPAPLQCGRRSDSIRFVGRPAAEGRGLPDARQVRGEKALLTT